MFINYEGIGILHKEKIEYFVDCFKFNWKNRYNFVDNLYPLNPHSVLLMLIDEIKFNGNNRNLNFFKSEFEKLFNNDPILRGEKFYIDQITQHILENKEYALQLCLKLLKKIDNGQYAKRLCEFIKEKLFNEEKLENCKEELRYLCISMIIELELYGYGDSYINKFWDNVFSGWDNIKSVNFTNYLFLPEKIQDSNDKIPEYMDNLSIKKRFEDIKLAFSVKRKCYYIVCSLTGIKGSELDIELNEVNIYNVRHIKKFNFESGNSIEAENINKKEIHVSAKVESIDIECAKKIAEEKIEKAIDVICCYSTSKVPIKIDFTDVIVLNENKKIVNTSFTIEGTEFEREVKGLNFDYDNVEELEKLYENYSGSVLKCTTRIAETIQDSGRWYRKGEDIKRKEDKFEFTLLMPTFASIDVNAAKKADKNARNAHIVNYLIKKYYRE